MPFIGQLTLERKGELKKRKKNNNNFISEERVVWRKTCH